MDNSVEGVTLLAGFIHDILRQYEDIRDSCGPLFAIAEPLDLSDPARLVPIATYNAICTWIEDNLGEASIRNAGRAIGVRAIAHVTANKDIGPAPSPSTAMHSLKWAADNMISDPKGRGWTILSDEPRRIVMRRTQTFNCMLQEGLLTGMLEPCPILSTHVEHVRCTRRGDEFCDYVVTWVERRR